MEFTVRNVNHALPEALWKLAAMGVKEDSRNGPVLRFPEPVTTTYLKPQERVLFWGERDCNPIFHLLESVWMLAGRRDVTFPALFNSRIGQYSDDGENFNAAYGYRWRHHFGQDQLLGVIKLLKTWPDTRQAVIQMWDPADLTKITLDKACNTQIFFEIRENLLNMTVICRSNDIWYGAYGANSVHMTFLQEFIAWAVGARIGVYRQYSHNLHLYTELYDAGKHLASPPDPDGYDAYSAGLVTPNPIGWNDDWQGWLRDAEAFCNAPFTYDKSMYSFFTDTALPMAMVSKVRKDKTGDGYEWANRIEASDWRRATLEWIERRELAKQK